jgi:hypothetical protein
MKKLILFLSATSFLLFTNCTKQIEFDAQDIAPRIVVNSLFTNDSLWAANISRSVGVLETTSYTSINDAYVSIFDGNGVQVTTLTNQGDGLYTSPTGATPVADELYTIEVSAPGYTSVSATNRIPTAVQINSIDTVSSTNSDGQTILETTINFQDPPANENFYMVEVLVKGTY